LLQACDCFRFCRPAARRLWSSLRGHDSCQAFLFRWDPASFTPSVLAFCRVAPAVRLSLRATSVVFVFSQAMAFNIWTSSLVQDSRGFLFFTIERFISESPISFSHIRSDSIRRTPANSSCGPPFGLDDVDEDDHRGSSFRFAGARGGLGAIVNPSSTRYRIASVRVGRAG
jgi:hypothetical protein